MDNMVLAVRTVLSKYATFDGRASRPEFWWWTLAALLASLATQIIDGLIFTPALGLDDPAQPLTMLYSLVILLPAIAVGVRRLHDTGLSGWWLLLVFLPLIGTLILLYFYTRPSDADNNWGPPNPLY